MPNSRRDFLKTSSAAALGAGLVGPLGLSARAFAAQDSTIRIGLVGCGGRGSKAAVQALSTPGPVKLVAMADAFADQLESSLGGITRAVADDDSAIVDVPKENRFVGFDAYKQVCDSDVDLVVFATPPGFRPIHFEYAVDKGKHVLMEKPVATDAPGVRKVLEAARIAKDKNLKVGVGLQRHHKNSYQECIQRIHDGEIGDVIAMRVYWNGGGVWEPRKSREEVATEMEYQMRNWYYYNWLCGDHIVEQHIHNLDVGNWIMGDYPVVAQGMGGREVRTDPRYGEIFDHHAVEFTYGNGTKMFSQCRHIRNCWNSVTEHAHGTKGVADLTNGREMGYELYDGGTWRFRERENDPYQVEHDVLFSAVRENTPHNEAENGAYSTLTAILGRMCTYSGKEIKFEEALNLGRSIMPEKFAWDASPPTLPNEEGRYPVPVPGQTRVLQS